MHYVTLILHNFFIVHIFASCIHVFVFRFVLSLLCCALYFSCTCTCETGTPWKSAVSWGGFPVKINIIYLSIYLTKINKKLQTGTLSSHLVPMTITEDDLCTQPKSSEQQVKVWGVDSSGSARDSRALKLFGTKVILLWWCNCNYIMAWAPGQIVLWT